MASEAVAVREARVGAALQQQPRRLHPAHVRRRAEHGHASKPPRRQPLGHRGVRVGARLGFGRIVASEKEVTNMLVIMV